MKEWFQTAWADIPSRIAIVVALVAVIPSWFIWSDRPAMTAVDSIILAGALLTLWLRGVLGGEHPLIAPGVILTVAGLLLEAAFFLLTDERPIPVLLIWVAGLVLIVSADRLERRQRA